MRRALYTFLFTTAVSLFLLLTGGCNNHPLDGVDYEHWSETGTESSSESGSATSYVGSEGGTEASDTGEDESTTGEPEPECGNGIVEPPEFCDDGVDNGSYPAPCSEMCTPNYPE